MFMLLFMFSGVVLMDLFTVSLLDLCTNLWVDAVLLYGVGVREVS